MGLKKSMKHGIVSIAVCIAVAIPLSGLPLSTRDTMNHQARVRAAYIAANPYYNQEQEEVLIEDWAIGAQSQDVVSDESNPSDSTTGETMPSDSVPSETSAPVIGEDVIWAEGAEIPTEMVDVSNGQIAQESYFEGYEPSVNTTSYYDDVPTYTIVQEYDEADLPIELLDPMVFAPDETQYYILAQNSIIKEYPDMSSITICPIARGEGVTRIGIGDTWSRIRTEDGVEGYVLTSSISDTMVWDAIDRTVYVDCGSLTLRSQPSTESEPVTTLYRDQRLHAISVSDKWYEVNTMDGQHGYVYISYTTTTAPPTPTPVPTRAPVTSSGGGGGGGNGGGGGGGGYVNNNPPPVISGVNGESIVSICESMLGVPYVWAGESRNGVDCSGLVVYAYRQVGVTVAHYSGTILNSGQTVSREDLRLGDVVCWDTNGNGSCDHVGIYVGNGQVIHASMSRGEVRYGNLDMCPILGYRRFIG